MIYKKKKTNMAVLNNERERERPFNQVVDEGVRVVGPENFEERPHVADDRPSHIAWRKGMFLLPQTVNIAPFVYFLKKTKHEDIDSKQNSKNQSQYI